MRCQLLSNSISPLEDSVEYVFHACSSSLSISHCYLTIVITLHCICKFCYSWVVFVTGE